VLRTAFFARAVQNSHVTMSARALGIDPKQSDLHPPLHSFVRLKQMRLLCYLLTANLLFATEPDSGALVKRMEARYRSPKTLEATFLEEYRENGRVVRVESGTAYFRRPGKMRWEYEVPEKNLFLVDGKTAWFYVPADHTVTRVPARQSADFRTPLALLAGEMKVSRVCAHIQVTKALRPENKDNIVLYCAVRGSDSAQTRDSSASSPDSNPDSSEAVFFETTPSSGELVRLLAKQSDGTEVDFHFRDWRFDPPIPEVMFHFQPPPGVAIVNGELPARDSSVN
jgi:outer membrane lipoprotein carrier protein